MERDRAANEERERKKRLATLNAGEKPFIALGKSGKEYVYFVTSSRSLECLTAREHTGLPLLQLAPKEYWDGIDARSGIKGTDCFQHCLDAHAGAAFDIHRVRGEGMWNEGGLVLYNAGASCYAVEKDRIVPVSSVRPGGRVYTSRVTMPEPGAGAEGGTVFTRGMPCATMPELYRICLHVHVCFKVGGKITFFIFSCTIF